MRTSDACRVETYNRGWSGKRSRVRETARCKSPESANKTWIYWWKADGPMRVECEHANRRHSTGGAQKAIKVDVGDGELEIGDFW